MSLIMIIDLTLKGRGSRSVKNVQVKILISPFVEFIYRNAELGIETGLAPVCYMYADCSKLKRMFSVGVNALCVNKIYCDLLNN